MSVDFAERIAALSLRAQKLHAQLETEEATKTALVMPFIAALGYDVFDPNEVLPEFVSDVGIKKGEKIDYAIKRNGETIMLIECKKVSNALTGSETSTEYSQLYRYFGVAKARIAVLTNGLQYRFYADLEEPNKMDQRPFLELDLLDVRENLVEELKKLSKAHFDVDLLLSAAAELKYLREIKAVLGRQFVQPEEDFARFFFSKTNPGDRFIASVRDQYTALVHKALQQFVADQLADRIRVVLNREDIASGRKVEASVPDTSPPPVPATAADDQIETTVDEIEGYHIVKSLVRAVIDPKRICYRDSKSYFSVLVDDNNRKAICRLWLNRKQKYISLFDAERNEEKLPIESLDDIYQYSSRLLESAQRLGQ